VAERSFIPRLTDIVEAIERIRHLSFEKLSRFHVARRDFDANQLAGFLR
jgi:hypothetical protein